MQRPSSSEQYITIVDNQGREKVQFVEYLVEDVRGEKVYVTSDGLAYTDDSLTFKLQEYLVAELKRLPEIFVQPDIVIWDPVDPPGETLIYYKNLYISQLQERKLMAVIVKVRQGVKLFYNFHIQESGKVKGAAVVPAAEIDVWYIAPRVRRGYFGL